MTLATDQTLSCPNWGHSIKLTESLAAPLVAATYLTGPRFKQRVECIAEKFTELRKDLDGERKWMNKQWAKRDRELTIILVATSGMYGDLQGIAGRGLQEIDALEGTMLLELDS